jgi:hypothetical protein
MSMTSSKERAIGKWLASIVPRPSSVWMKTGLAGAGGKGGLADPGDAVNQDARRLRCAGAGELGKRDGHLDVLLAWGSEGRSVRRGAQLLADLRCDSRGVIRARTAR